MQTKTGFETDMFGILPKNVTGLPGGVASAS